MNAINIRVKNLIIIFSVLVLCILPGKLQANEPMTLYNFAKELIRQDIKHWKVVMAQGILESGWEFDSYLFQQTNNFIGMRIPNARKSMRTGEFKGYSSYDKWQDCVADVKIWQKHNWKGGTEDEYMELMDRIWAESPVYKAHLKLVIRRIDRLIAQVKEQHKNHFNYHILTAYAQKVNHS